MIIGHVCKDGTVSMLMGADNRSFKVEKTSIGEYTIHHNLNNEDVVVSISPEGKPVNFGVDKVSPNRAVVSCRDFDGATDVAFGFTIMWAEDKDMCIVGERGDLTALIDYKGHIYRFNHPKQLKEFADSIY